MRTRSRLLEFPRVGQQGLHLLLVLGTLLGQRLVEQLLAGRAVRHSARSAQHVVRGRHAWVKLEDLRQRTLLALAQLEDANRRNREIDAKQLGS